MNLIVQEGKSYAHDNGADLFMEVSALTGESVETLFLTVGELMNSVEVFLNFCWFLFTFIIATVKKGHLLLVLQACVMPLLI